MAEHLLKDQTIIDKTANAIMDLYEVDKEFQHSVDNSVEPFRYMIHYSHVEYSDAFAEADGTAEYHLLVDKMEERW